MKRRWLCLIAALLPLPVLGDFTMTVIHTNDLHAHVEPVKVKGEELGGYARQATLIKQLRAQSKNPVVLNGGDTFQGTLYFNVYKGMADAAFMNAVGYQAMAVGNHEFDLGPQALADFARSVTFPVLAANLDISGEPLLKDTVQPSTVIEVGGQKLGVVGAVTPDLPFISSPGDNVKMKDIVPSVQAAIDDLARAGIDKIVLVSHCGYGLEKDLATKLRGIDAVIGGHSHTFLGDTKLPGDLKGAGPYPTVVKNADGDTSLVVQSWEWGKVVGKLEITFDDHGKVKGWSKDQPIAVTQDIPEDPLVKSIVSALKKPIEDLMNKVLGESLAEIPRSGPGPQGPMADLICDAMLDATKQQGAVIALMNAGGIRSSLNAGKITYGDAIAVQPFNNSLVVLDLTGAELAKALSSGILFVSRGSSFKRGPGDTATEIVVAGKPLDPGATYRCAMNSFIAKGGDALDVLKDAKGYRYDTGILDIDALLEAIKTRSPLDLKGEGRIR